MSWVDKVHKNIRREKEVDRVLNDKRYQEELRKRDEQSVLKAMGWLSMMACEFFELNYEYNAEDLKRFLHFIKLRIEETGDDPEYFGVILKHYKDNYGVEVDKELGIDFGL